MSTVQDPRFWTLKAAPERYLKIPSSTVIAVIKALEGFIAILLAMKAIGFMITMIGSGLTDAAVNPLDAICAVVPEELIRAVSFGSDSVIKEFYPTGGFAPFLVLALTACLIVFLACVVVDSIAMLLLRFAMNGSGVMAKAHKIILAVNVIMLLIVLAMAAITFYHYFTAGIRLYDLATSIRALIIVTAAAVILLAAGIRYHTSVITVLEIISYELGMGYRETHLPELKLSGYIVFFGLVCGAAAIITGIQEGFLNMIVFFLVMQVVKYVALMDSWRTFRRCHM